MRKINLEKIAFLANFAEIKKFLVESDSKLILERSDVKLWSQSHAEMNTLLVFGIEQ
jgi:hypothetical protein